MEGEVKILEDKNIGFLDGAFIPPDLVDQYQLENGSNIQGKAILNFNKTKNEWGWRVVNIKYE